MPRPRPTPDDTLWSATADLLHASQQLVLDRVDLFEVDARSELARIERTAVAQLGRAGRMAGALAVVAVLASVAWVALSAAAAVALQRWWPTDAALLAVALGNATFAAVLAAAARRALAQPSPAQEPHDA